MSSWGTSAESAESRDEGRVRSDRAGALDEGTTAPGRCGVVSVLPESSASAQERAEIGRRITSGLQGCFASLRKARNDKRADLPHYRLTSSLRGLRCAYILALR
jgi:hypothetical protein